MLHQQSEKKPKPPSGFQFGQTNVTHFVDAIHTPRDFEGACWVVKAMHEEGNIYDRDIYGPLIERGRMLKIPEREVLELIASGGTKPGSAPLETITADTFAKYPAPPQRFIDGRNFIPRGMVTVLTGAGGIGKTLVGLQLLAGTALKSTWLGQPVNQDGKGVSLFYSAEEPKEVIHRRLEEIAATERFDLADLGGFHMHFTEEDGELFTPGEKKNAPLVSAPAWARLVARCDELKPDLLVIDNRTQVVAANENDRVVAGRTMMFLDRLARRLDMAVIIMSHPSLSSINVGGGNSGSTAWQNSARSQLLMKRPDKDSEEMIGPDDGRRIITTEKYNHGLVGQVINLRWEMGCYVCTDKPERAGSDIGRGAKAERVFMKLMEKYERRGFELSPSANSSRSYAPALFANDDTREGVNKREFERAMMTLLDKGALTIQVIDSGKAREKRRLVVVR